MAAKYAVCLSIGLSIYRALLAIVVQASTIIVVNKKLGNIN